MDRNGFIYFNTRLSPKNSGKADSYAWAIMILDEVLPYQDVTDLKENGNQPAEFNVNLITAFKVDVKVSQSYTNENGGKIGGNVVENIAGNIVDVPSLSQALSLVLSPVCPQLSEVQLKKMVSVIDYLFRASGSITELMDCAGEKNKSRFRQTILKPLVDTGLVEPTIKDIPNSPKQKYALTDNGRENLQTISWQGRRIGVR